MIFTIGHKLNYEEIFNDISVPIKLGKTDDYGGGIAFRSIEEANAYILSNCSNSDYVCYGLDCKWDNTYWSEPHQHFCIINNTRLIKIC